MFQDRGDAVDWTITLEPWTLWRRTTPAQRFLGGLIIFFVMGITWALTEDWGPWSFPATAFVGLLTGRVYYAVTH